MNKTAFVFHELYLWHDAGRAALEVPAGLRVQPDAHIEIRRRSDASKICWMRAGCPTFCGRQSRVRRPPKKCKNCTRPNMSRASSG